MVTAVQQLNIDLFGQSFEPFAAGPPTPALANLAKGIDTNNLINGGTVAGNLTVTGNVTVQTNNGLILTGQTTDAAAATATLTNSPTAGNPAFWLRIIVNGTNMAVPAWAA